MIFAQNYSKIISFCLQQKKYTFYARAKSAGFLAKISSYLKQDFYIPEKISSQFNPDFCTQKYRIPTNQEFHIFLHNTKNLELVQSIFLHFKISDSHQSRILHIFTYFSFFVKLHTSSLFWEFLSKLPYLITYCEHTVNVL